MTSLRHSRFTQRFASQCSTFANPFVCLLLIVMNAVTNNLHTQTYTDMHDFNCQTDGCGASYAVLWRRVEMEICTVRCTTARAAPALFTRSRPQVRSTLSTTSTGKMKGMAPRPA
jgi:hypothetical protein